MLLLQTSLAQAARHLPDVTAAKAAAAEARTAEVAVALGPLGEAVPLHRSQRSGSGPEPSLLAPKSARAAVEVDASARASLAEVVAQPHAPHAHKSVAVYASKAWESETIHHRKAVVVTVAGCLLVSAILTLRSSQDAPWSAMAAEAKLQAELKLEGAEKASDKEEVPQIYLWQMFRFASSAELVVLFVGMLAAAAQGAAFPCFAIILGDSVHATAGRGYTSACEAMRGVLVSTMILGTINFACGTLWNACFLWAASRQTAKMRVRYFQAILRQDIAWFDKNDPATLPTRLATEIMIIQDAIGPKSGQATFGMSQCLVGLVLAMLKGWELTLIILAAIPTLLVVGGYAANQILVMNSKQQEGFARAGAIAEEVMTAMRTVAAFGAEFRETKRFEDQLKPAKKAGIFAALQMGVTWSLILATFALLNAFAFWYGAHHMVAQMAHTGADVAIVVTALIISTSAINTLRAPLSSIMAGMSAAAQMISILDRKPEIEPNRDSFDFKGELPKKVETIERIDFQDVCFSYPSRPEVPVLRGLTLSIQAGQNVALVAESGSGKSTVIQLLERFYNPTSGKILVNGVPLETLPPRAWRKTIGYVGQEPVLFAASVLENIKAGDVTITNADAVAAARRAEALEFIEALPHKFAEFVGVGGGQLSGGQKQRIAIARALVKQPQVLLLDEATSALDHESEKQVQATIAHLQSTSGSGLTTVTVAHRLTTIKNCNVIYTLKHGRVAEQGTHTELLAKEGEYYSLVKAQSTAVDGIQANSDASPKGELSPDAKAPKWKRHVSGGSDETKATEHSEAASRKSEWELEQERYAKLGDYQPPLARLFRMSRPEWSLYAVMLVCAMIAGGMTPLQGYVFSQAMAGLYVKPIQVMLQRMDVWAFALCTVAVGNFVGECGLFSITGYIQECLALRLRRDAFKSVLRQEIAFFDDPENRVLSLTETLARQARRVTQVTGEALGITVAALFAVFSGITFSFAGSWRLSLAILGLIPIVGILVVSAASMTVRGIDSEKLNLSMAAQVASEAILNVRTVRAIQSEKQLVEVVSEAVSEFAKDEQKAAPVQGLGFGLSTGVIYIVYIVGFWYGAKLIDNTGMDPAKVHQSLLCILCGVIGGCVAATFAPDLAQGRLAAHDIFRLIDRPTQIDAIEPEGTQRDTGDGTIEFKDVSFRFPHRENMHVLSGLSFTVTAGQSVALVGPSGSGKSTVLQLLQRFYDPLSGTILVGGTDLRCFDIAWWRRKVGFVGQEPVLFDMSLEDNVKYGAPDATRAQVEAAAKLANMDYALNGMVAWEESVGIRGEKLSGGQKQRCAIARALIRQPEVLLLDEATSALDSASEQVVQQALDAAREGRTTLTIAHRLSTIKDSDLILVVKGGTVVESGNHESLMAAKGFYQHLVKLGQD